MADNLLLSKSNGTYGNSRRWAAALISRMTNRERVIRLARKFHNALYAMPLYRSQSFPPEKLLVVAANLLHKSFHNTSRMMAKRRFQLLESGKTIFLVNVRMEDNSELQINLKLDRSELKGKLNFSTFRQLIAQLLHGFMQKLEAKETLRTFADEDGKRWSYLIPALLQTENLFDMMILGADVREPGVLTLELIFIDPEQFRKTAPAA